MSRMFPWTLVPRLDDAVKCASIAQKARTINRLDLPTTADIKPVVSVQLVSTVKNKVMLSNVARTERWRKNEAELWRVNGLLKLEKKTRHSSEVSFPETEEKVATIAVSRYVSFLDLNFNDYITKDYCTWIARDVHLTCIGLQVASTFVPKTCVAWAL